MFDVDLKTGEIYIYDIIGPSDFGMVDGLSVINALKQIEGQATIRINSPGGYVDEATAIYNAIRRHKGGSVAVIDSLAASAASYIAMASDRVVVADGAMVMIHKPLSGVFGNATYMRAEADVLDKYELAILDAYKKRMKATGEELRAMLDAETWMTAQEAVELGFADAMEFEAVEPTRVPSNWYQRTPENLKAVAAAGTRTPYNIGLARVRNKLTRIKHSV